MQMNIASVIADESQAQRLSGLPRAIPLIRAEPGPEAGLWSPGSLLLPQVWCSCQQLVLKERK